MALTHRRRHRYSHCTYIRRPPKCVRFRGCKYASKGTKKKYCRKRHSRKTKKSESGALTLLQ